MRKISRFTCLNLSILSVIDLTPTLLLECKMAYFLCHKRMKQLMVRIEKHALLRLLLHLVPIRRKSYVHCASILTQYLYPIDSIWLMRCREIVRASFHIIRWKAWSKACAQRRIKLDTFQVGLGSFFSLDKKTGEYQV